MGRGNQLAIVWGKPWPCSSPGHYRVYGIT